MRNRPAFRVLAAILSLAIGIFAAVIVVGLALAGVSGHAVLVASVPGVVAPGWLVYLVSAGVALVSLAVGVTTLMRRGRGAVLSKG